MCKKNKDESWTEFVFRMFCEEPQTILAFVGFAIAVGLYLDGRCLLQEMTSAYQNLSREILEFKHEMKTEMHDATSRVSRLEDWHKYEDARRKVEK